METWPADGIDLSDDVVRSLEDLTDTQLATFYAMMTEFGLDIVDVYGQFKRREISDSSRVNIEYFLGTPGPVSLYIESAAMIIEVQRRPSWGLRVAGVVVATVH